MIENGIYCHFKGGIYEVICSALNSETQEEMVVYKSLSDGRVWVRPASMWNEKVIRDGKEYIRFEKIQDLDK